MNKDFIHLTLPFHIDPTKINEVIDLSQVHEFDQRYSDSQVLNTIKGQIAVKRQNGENYLFKLKKFVNKQDPNQYFYKLQYEGLLTKTYDSESYFQDFYYPSLSEEDALRQFKQYIQTGELNLTQTPLPAQLVKPFSWHGSNFRFENIDKQVNKTKFIKKPINSIKFDDPIPIETLQPNELIKQLFKQQPIWLKSDLKELLNRNQVQDAGNLLKNHVYSYLDGPWARCYLLNGYDPKANPINAKYQTIVIVKQNIEDIEQEQILKPLKNQNVHHLCNVKIGEVQKLIQLAISKAENGEIQISKKHGWLNRRIHKQIVKIIKGI